MKLRTTLTAIGLVCGVSTAVLAHEAPVVDAQQQQQQNAAVSTQAEGSTGGSWQPVASNNANSNTPQQEGGWQSTSAVSNSGQEVQPVPTQASATPTQEYSVPSGSVDTRVARLEQQIANYNQMNLPQQVTDLQQKNAELQGKLDVADHTLKTLTDQQKLYYQDLEQQIAQLEKQKGIKGVPSAAADKNIADNTTTDTNKKMASNESSVFTKKADIPVTADNADVNTDVPETASADQTDQSAKPINLLAAKKTPSLSDADTYGKAFRSLSNKHFDAAQNEFHDYLSEYPKGRFAVNAHFWLGEIALMHEKYNLALGQFQTVVSDYPNSSKVSDAKLKIAMIHAATGKMDLARTEFKQICRLYPGSTAAQLASIRLQQLANVTSTQLT